MERPAKRIRMAGVLAAVLGMLLLVSALVSAFRYLNRRAEARDVLRRCRTLELAVLTVMAEYRPNGQPFFDKAAAHGFAEGAEARVKSLSGCEGDLYLMQWDEAVGVEQLLYIEGDYAAWFARGDGGTGSWSVYREQHLIP